MKEPIFLYFDDLTSGEYKKMEADVITLFKTLQLTVKKIIDDAPICYNRLTTEGSDVLVEAYHDAYVHKHPKHLNKAIRVENEAGVKMAEVDSMINAFNQKNKGMGVHKITISDKNVLISNINENSFKKYLSEDKREIYECVNIHIENVKKLHSLLEPNSETFIYEAIMNSLRNNITLLNNDINIKPERFI